MLAKDLALALSIITRVYPEAKVVYSEVDKCLVVEEAGHMSQQAEDVIRGLGLKYSESHGVCWYAHI